MAMVKPATAIADSTATPAMAIHRSLGFRSTQPPSGDALTPARSNPLERDRQKRKRFCGRGDRPRPTRLPPNGSSAHRARPNGSRQGSERKLPASGPSGGSGWRNRISIEPATASIRRPRPAALFSSCSSSTLVMKPISSSTAGTSGASEHDEPGVAVAAAQQRRLLAHRLQQGLGEGGGTVLGGPLGKVEQDLADRAIAARQVGLSSASRPSRAPAPRARCPSPTGCRRWRRGSPRRAPNRRAVR